MKYPDVRVASCLPFEAEIYAFEFRFAFCSLRVWPAGGFPLLDICDEGFDSLAFRLGLLSYLL